MQKGFKEVNLHGCVSGMLSVPVIGENGNWYIGNEDTGMNAGNGGSSSISVKTHIFSGNDIGMITVIGSVAMINVFHQDSVPSNGIILTVPEGFRPKAETTDILACGFPNGVSTAFTPFGACVRSNGEVIHDSSTSRSNIMINTTYLID